MFTHFDAGSALGVGLGIFGIAATVYLYFRARERPRVAYLRSTRALLDGDSPLSSNAVEIRYAGQLVPAVVRTVIALWNGGRRTIDADDVVAKDPLRIEFSCETEILRARVLNCSRAVNGVRVRAGRSEVGLEFDFLDYMDGALIEILHTTTGAKAAIFGTVKGMPRGPEFRGSISAPGEGALHGSGHVSALDWLKRHSHQLGASMTIIGSASLALGALLVGRASVGDPSAGVMLTVLAAAGASIVGSGLLGLWARRPRVPKAILSEPGEEA